MYGRGRPSNLSAKTTKFFGAFLVYAAALWLIASPAFAQTAPSPTVAPGVMPQASEAQTKPLTPSAKRKLHAEMVERINANTVSIISGTPGATYFRAASDIAFALDDGDNLRILPILGKGAEQNAYDILYLKGVDLGF